MSKCNNCFPFYQAESYLFFSKNVNFSYRKLNILARYKSVSFTSLFSFITNF